MESTRAEGEVETVEPGEEGEDFESEDRPEVVCAGEFVGGEDYVEEGYKGDDCLGLFVSVEFEDFDFRLASGRTVIRTMNCGYLASSMIMKMSNPRIAIVKRNCRIRTTMKPRGRAVRCALEVAIVFLPSCVGS